MDYESGSYTPPLPKMFSAVNERRFDAVLSAVDAEINLDFAERMYYNLRKIYGVYCAKVHS